jgi:hypothetical protein
MFTVRSFGLIGIHFKVLRITFWKCDNFLKTSRCFQIEKGWGVLSHGIAFKLPGPKIQRTGCRVPRKVGNGRGVHCHLLMYVRVWYRHIEQG